MCIKYLKERCNESGARLSSVVPSDRPGASGHTVTQQVPSQHQETLLLLWRCTGCPGWQGVPYLQIFKSHLDMVLGSWLWVVLLDQRIWTRWPPEVLFKLNFPLIFSYGRSSCAVSSMHFFPTQNSEWRMCLCCFKVTTLTLPKCCVYFCTFPTKKKYQSAGRLLTTCYMFLCIFNVISLSWVFW